MRVETVDQLAAELGRPATGWSGLAQLDPEEIALLAELIRSARKKRRAELDKGLGNVVPGPLDSALVALLRRGPR